MVVSNTTISNKDDFIRIIKDNKKTVVFKFGADWCGPCKKISRDIELFKESIIYNENIVWFDIDVDESVEIFGMLKTKRIVNGVPAVLAYFSDNNTIYPDEFVLGANKDHIYSLFSCILSRNNITSG
jgi:thiol-disulfide isomerase/thioredoxin